MDSPLSPENGSLSVPPKKDDSPPAAPEVKKIDFGVEGDVEGALSYFKNHNTKISIEPPETDQDAMHRRRKDTLLFCFELVFLAVILAGLGVAIFNGTVDDKRWAMALVAAIAGALARHLFSGGKG